ncbi:bifunctional riboflavin kinase/FMN adenylyltransferase [Spiroplasma sabaudiense Ar-1343]|uniref:FAD synthase n=1 Tax=Spiroplasma sabaudiense Ar-1343 TaxID=1276257 RepID=W6A9W2_9MOLU|nr:hypothetical protein [Spiroplasma sabaudiense]AHI53968.1 bifunctional riboflavin kinase/FMN adenylyltransferase [Spiroplasma sabaudiense Ar-1343]
MKIIKINLSKEIEKVQIQEPSVAAIGFFDGIHRIHQEILKKTAKIAVKNDLASVIITFSRKVKSYLSGNSEQILDNEIKYKEIEDLTFIDYVIEIDVNEEMIKISKEDFLEWMKTKVNVKKIVVGSDLSFGYRGQGDIYDLLAKFGTDNVVIYHRVDEFSSSEIKELIATGHVAQANKMMLKKLELKISKIKANLYESEDNAITVMDGKYQGLVEGKKINFYVIANRLKINDSELEGIEPKTVIFLKYLGK